MNTTGYITGIIILILIGIIISLVTKKKKIETSQPKKEDHQIAIDLLGTIIKQKMLFIHHKNFSKTREEILTLLRRS